MDINVEKFSHKSMTSKLSEILDKYVKISTPVKLKLPKLKKADGVDSKVKLPRLEKMNEGV